MLAADRICDPCADTSRFGERWFDAGRGRGRFNAIARDAFGASPAEQPRAHRRAVVTLQETPVLDTGARRLARAVIWDAYASWQRRGDDPRLSRDHETIRAWVGGAPGGLTFERCCTAIGLESDFLRAAFSRVRPLVERLEILAWASVWIRQRAARAERERVAEQREVDFRRAAEAWGAEWQRQWYALHEPAVRDVLWRLEETIRTASDDELVRHGRAWREHCTRLADVFPPLGNLARALRLRLDRLVEAATAHRARGGTLAIQLEHTALTATDDEIRRHGAAWREQADAIAQAYASLPDVRARAERAGALLARRGYAITIAGDERGGDARRELLR